MTLKGLSALSCLMAFGGVPTGRPYVMDVNGERNLHFDGVTIQSAMLLDAPEALALDYTRTMMGFLLFVPEPRRIEMIGLGGGSLAKYCYRHLPAARITVVEINEEVIALRDAFGIPADDDRFAVIQGDGADFVRGRGGDVDVLLVDGFDVQGQPSQLCSQGFYDHCHARLGEGGVMAVNLFSGDRRYGVYAQRIRECFEGQVVFVAAEEGSNRIAFACKGRGFPPSRASLLKRARALARRFDFAPVPLAQRILHRLERRAGRQDAPGDGHDRGTHGRR